MLHTKKILFAIFFTLFLSAQLAFFLPLSVQAAGVSPGALHVNDLVNGISIEKEINVTRSELGEEAYFTVELSGEDARYADLPTKNFTIPADKRSFAYRFFIRPVGAQNGEHEFKLLFMQHAGPDTAKNSGAAVTVQSGAAATVRFTVTDRQIKSLKIISTSVTDTEVGLPIDLSFVADNKGNVDIRPTKIVVTLTDLTDNTNTIEQTISDTDIEIIPPFVRKEVQIPIQQTLDLGSYAVKAVFFLDNRVIYESGKLYVTVHPKGTLAQEASLVSYEASSQRVKPNELVKLTAVIENSGEVAIEPVFIVEIKKDGTLFDLLRAEKKAIFKDQSGSFFLTFRPEEEGVYTTDAYFEYGNKQTAHSKLDITVDRKSGMGSGLFINVLLSIGIVGLIALVAYIIRKKFFLK